MTDLTVTEVRNAMRCPRVFALGRSSKKRVVFPVGASALGAVFHRIAERFTRSLAKGNARIARVPTSAPVDEIAYAVGGALLAPLIVELDRNPTYGSIPAEVDDLAEALRAYGAYLAQRIAGAPGNVRDVLAGFAREAEVPVRMEVDSPNGAVVLNGRIDAIHAPNDHAYEVVEYKLTDESTEELDRAQVALYRRMLQGNRNAVPVILRFSPGLVTTRLEPTEADAWVERSILPLLVNMVGWIADPASAPPTTRHDLCPACPLRNECVALYQDDLPARDDPPGSALRPRPAPEGDVELLQPLERGVADADPTNDDAAQNEATRLTELVTKLYHDQSVAAVVKQPPRIGSRIIRVELTASRGSIRQIDSAQADVLHHLEADHGIVASFERAGARRIIDAVRKTPRDVRLAPLLVERREWLREHAGRSVVGETVDGAPLCLDLSEPTSCHLLVGGTTGSGKSVLLKTIAAGLVEYQPPSAIALTLVDPKRVTFAGVQAALGAHLARPVCFDAPETLTILADLVADMEDRYESFAARKVENLDDYNDTVPAAERLPRHVVVIDEFQDLLATKTTKDEFLESVQRLGAKARAAGIHLVLATQHPDRKTVPAAVKVNMTGKIALKVHQAVDSQVVLGAPGAEKLLGHGDLLADLGHGIVRAQGALS